jgi:ribosomal protein S18 acetylase RimI-like enzyme
MEHHMIQIQKKPLTDALKKTIYEGFHRHAIEKTGYDEKGEPVALLAMDGDTFCGACVFELFWGSLRLIYVYVEEKYCGHGLGTKLVNMAFEYGRENKCPFAFVETMSFQALGFYQKLGFELEFTRRGYAHGTSFHYLKKNLIEE